MVPQNTLAIFILKLPLTSPFFHLLYPTCDSTMSRSLTECCSNPRSSLQLSQHHCCSSPNHCPSSSGPGEKSPHLFPKFYCSILVCCPCCKQRSLSLLLLLLFFTVINHLHCFVLRLNTKIFIMASEPCMFGRPISHIFL